MSTETPASIFGKFRAFLGAREKKNSQLSSTQELDSNSSEEVADIEEQLRHKGIGPDQIEKEWQRFQKRILVQEPLVYEYIKRKESLGNLRFLEVKIDQDFDFKQALMTLYKQVFPQGPAFKEEEPVVFFDDMMEKKFGDSVSSLFCFAVEISADLSRERILDDSQIKRFGDFFRSHLNSPFHHKINKALVLAPNRYVPTEIGRECTPCYRI